MDSAKVECQTQRTGGEENCEGLILSTTCSLDIKKYENDNFKQIIILEIAQDKSDGVEKNGNRYAGRIKSCRGSG